MKFDLTEQIKFEIKSLKENYPSFVTSNSVKHLGKEIPVFVFHTIKPKQFEKQLEFISINGYNTLSINEYYEIITGKTISDQKNILLTFDDGRSSFWRFAFPLLKKYNLKATLFVNPGIIPNSNPSYNLDNVWQDKKTLSEIDNIDKEDKKYCSWQELKKMYDSQLIDIESHTLMHKVVFTGKEIIGFCNKNTHNSILTTYRTIDEINKEFNKENYFGYPIFSYEPLLRGNINYKVEKNLMEFCRNYFLQHNNEKDWQKHLLNKIKNDIEKNLKEKNLNQVIREIEEDFKISSNLLKEKINNASGFHLCLPWTIGSDIAIELAKKTNYKSVFWGATKKKINKPGDNPFYNCRIKNDFIFRLPGRKRKTLVKIYISKVYRRLKSEAVY